MSQLRIAACIVGVSLLVCACRGVDSKGSGGSTGELTLGITDGPADGVDNVRVAFSGIEVTPTGGSPILIDNLDEDYVDLLDLQGGMRELLLDEYDIADGSYESVRFIFDPINSFVEVNNTQYELIVPANQEPNLTLSVSLFFDPDNNLEDFTLDIDLRKSLHIDNSQSPPVYELHPRVRFVETDRTETLRGTVHEDLITNSNCANQNNNEDGNAVYLFENSGANFQDIQNNSGDPYATTTVIYNSANDQWEFAFGYLPRQSYRAYFTCDAILDEPTTNDLAMIQFEGPIPIEVTQGNTDTLRFDP